ncbi:MAG TPA: hypothetical protein VJH92_04910 [Candidatus Nanoarchaeia archaeon]|nr:hypothetical protein [Candidatus Nanoarchaeia archaeon]
MRVEKTEDLNITFYRKDVEQLKNKKILDSTTNQGLGIKIKVGKTERDKWIDVREVATIQEMLPFTDYEIFEHHLNAEKLVHGYNIILREDLFYQWTKEAEENPHAEITNPFWARGLQFKIQIDRIHIMYRPSVL